MALGEEKLHKIRLLWDADAGPSHTRGKQSAKNCAPRA